MGTPLPAPSSHPATLAGDKRRAGMSLVEILVILAVLFILCTVAVPMARSLKVRSESGRHAPELREPTVHIETAAPGNNFLRQH